MSVARSHHSVCTFNDKFIFVFGGRTMKNGKIIKSQTKTQFIEPYILVKEVEVFEFAKNTWKTINYISEPERLMVLLAGCMQIAGS